MAGWGEKLNQVTKSAISKSKEMAEVTRLNMEISNHTQKIKEIQTAAGEYVLENGLLAEEEKIAAWMAEIADIRVQIEANQGKIQDIKNINICPGCGAEVSRNSKFCDKCGAEMVRASIEPETNKCAECGSPLEPGAAFCSNCGAKQ